MTQLVTFPFTGTNGTSIATTGLVSAHASTGGSALIQTNSAQITSGAAGGYAYADREAWRYDASTPKIADAEWSGTFTWNQQNGGRLYFMFRIPGADLNAQTGYAITIDSGGLTWARADNWSLADQTGVSRNHAAGTAYGFRFRVAGSTIQGRTWLASGAEPTAWDINVTDTTYAAAGYTGFVLYGGSTATANQITVDNLTITDGQASVQPPTVTISASSTTLKNGERAVLTATGTDPAGLALTYAWTTTAGTMRDAIGPTASLKCPPLTAGATATVTCTATNTGGKTGTATATINLGTAKIRTATAALHRPRAADGFVYCVGQQLMLNGRQWRPVGINLPWSMGWGNSKAPTAAQHQTMFATMPAGSIFRMWAFGNWTVASIKAVVDLARPYGHKFILVLADYLGATSGEKYVAAAGSGAAFTAGAWSSGGWRDNWLKPMLQQFANDPAIAMWEPINEPDPTDANVRTFFDQAGAFVRQYDTRHLISTGTAASWGAHVAMQLASSSVYIDVASMHEYDETEAPSNWVDKDLPDATTARKPLIVGESGITQAKAGSESARAALISQKIAACKTRPAIAAYIYWSGAAPGSFGTGDYEIDITANGSGTSMGALAGTSLL